VTVTGAPRSAVPGLVVLEGAMDEAARTERVRATAVEGRQWRGYARAWVALARTIGCVTDLHVAVTLGPRYRIAAIKFATVDAFPRARRLAALEDALGTVNTVGGVLIEYRLRRALDELAARYRDAGWLDVAIADPVTTYDARGAVAITIPIAAGERYRVATVLGRARGQRELDAVDRTELGAHEQDAVGGERHVVLEQLPARRGGRQLRRDVARLDLGDQHLAGGGLDQVVGAELGLERLAIDHGGPPGTRLARDDPEPRAP
jgi:hypothetical protein